MKKEVFLRRVPLFTGLSATDLAQVASIAQVREVKKGEIIFDRATSGDRLYLVVQGLVKIFGRSASGKTKTFAYLKARDFFGEMALLGKGGRSASAKALAASTLLTLQEIDFSRLLRQRPEMARSLLQALCERLRRANQEIETLSFNSVVGRVAQVLVDLSHRHGEKVPEGVRLGLDLSHQELAERVGTAREMVSRVLNRFVRTGCLRTEGKSLVLLDIPKLSGWVF